MSAWTSNFWTPKYPSLDSVFHELFELPLGKYILMLAWSKNPACWSPPEGKCGVENGGSKLLERGLSCVKLSVERGQEGG